MAKLVAHRGASAQAIENTIAAFELAITLGADFVEFDVLQTRDGVLVVKHDEWIDGRHISEIDYETIITDSRFSHLPTFAETVKRIAGRIKLFVELKHPGYEQEVIDTLHRYVDNSQFVIISFEDEVIKNTKQYDPGIRAGLCLVHRNHFSQKLVLRKQDIFHMERIRETGADFIAPRCMPVMATSLLNAYWHGTPLYVWVVNDYWTYRALSLLGKVEAIATDIPAHMTPAELYSHPHRRRARKLLNSLSDEVLHW